MQLYAVMLWYFLWIAAAAAAKSLQSCWTLCDPIDGSPPGSPVPGILQTRVLEWGAIAFSDFSELIYCILEGDQDHYKTKTATGMKPGRNLA